MDEESEDQETILMIIDHRLILTSIIVNWLCNMYFKPKSNK